MSPVPALQTYVQDKILDAEIAALPDSTPTLSGTPNIPHATTPTQPSPASYGQPQTRELALLSASGQGRGEDAPVVELLLSLSPPTPWSSQHVAPQTSTLLYLT